MVRSVTDIALLGSVATLFFMGPAWAYLDPGTGSMMLQLLLGGVAGALVVGRLYWGRFRTFLTSRFSRKRDKTAHAQHGARGRKDTRASD